MTISKRNRQRKKYTDNNAHANIDPNVQNMSKIQVLRMILHEGAQKNPRESCRVSEKIISSTLIRDIVRKMDRSGNESK